MLSSHSPSNSKSDSSDSSDSFSQLLLYIIAVVVVFLRPFDPPAPRRQAEYVAAGKKPPRKRLAAHGMSGRQKRRVRGPLEDAAVCLVAHPTLPQFACVRETHLQVYDCPTRRLRFSQALDRPGYCCAYSPDARLVAVGLQGAVVPPADMTAAVHTVVVYGFPATGGGNDGVGGVDAAAAAAASSPTSSAEERRGSRAGQQQDPPVAALFRLFSWRHAERHVPSSVTACRFSPDGKLLLVGTDVGHLLSYDARPGGGGDFQLLCRVARANLQYVQALDFSECSTYVRAADSSGSVTYLHLYRPTVIYVLRPSRLPLDKIRWATTSAAMADQKNDPGAAAGAADDNDAADDAADGFGGVDFGDPFRPEEYVEISVPRGGEVDDEDGSDDDQGSDNGGDGEGGGSGSGRGGGSRGGGNTSSRRLSSTRTSKSRPNSPKRQCSVSARRRQQRQQQRLLSRPADILVGSHANGCFSVVTTRSTSKYCRWDSTASTATYGGNASRLAGLAVTAGGADGRQPRHLLTVSKAQHCVLQWSVVPTPPLDLLSVARSSSIGSSKNSAKATAAGDDRLSGKDDDEDRSADKGKGDNSSAAAAPTAVAAAVKGEAKEAEGDEAEETEPPRDRASWSKVKQVHESLVISRLEARKEELTAAVAAIVSPNVFAPPSDFASYPSLEWVFGRSDACNLQLGEAGAAV